MEVFKLCVIILKDQHCSKCVLLNKIDVRLNVKK